MNTPHISVLAVLACGLAASPAVGQDVAAYAPVESAWYTLVGSDLTIEVDAATPGTLLVVRGEPGRVHVRARSDGGLPAFSFSDRGRARLRLGGAAAEGITYVVVVPDRARITVRLPGRDLPESLRTLEASRSFEWGGADADEPDPAARERPRGPPAGR